MAISSNATGLRPGVCTSTTRPTTPYTGMLIYETDTGYLRVWDGSAWDYLSQSQNGTTNLPISDIGKAWTTWTPNVRPETGAWTAGVLEYATYTQINKTVIGNLLYRITTVGTGNGSVFFDLPVTALRGATVVASIGSGREAALSGDTFNVYLASATVAAIRRYNNTAMANGNNSLPVFFFYEAA